MKLRAISFMVIVALLFLGACISQPPIRIESPKTSIQRSKEVPARSIKRPIRVISPRCVPYCSSQYILEIRNGLAYCVEITIGINEKIYLVPGGQVFISFGKSRYQRRVIFSGVVLRAADKIIGIISKKIKVPSLRDKEDVRGFWQIRKFERLRK